MQLMCSAFPTQGKIPDHYTCVGKSQSPPLSWDFVPAGVNTFVLICDTPDSPTGKWNHWILYNIPPYVRRIEEGARALSEECEDGLNSWGKKGYGGPCPPGGEYRYCFKLYALDTRLNFKSPPKKQELERVINLAK